MNYAYLVIGILLFLLIVVDIIKTTFTSKGGGPLTTLLSHSIWRVFFILSGKKGTSTLLSYAGTAILIAVLLSWVAGMWVGLLLMLLSDPGSVVTSTTRESTDFLEKLYYAGFTLSTLGVGDYNASNNTWRVVTSVAAFSGLAFITASITYFVPVLQAVGLQSKLSLYIHSMGTTPQKILKNGWNGEDLSCFSENVADVCQMLMQHIMHHHSYPVIHYFNNNLPKLAISPAIVLLAEVYHLLKYAIPPQKSIDKIKMTMLETTIDSYLEVIKSGFLDSSNPSTTAPIPDLQQLRTEGIPLQDEVSFKNALQQEVHERRKLLTLMLETDGWSWEQVYGKV
ncbi:potassium channel family protein [Pontibacter sp. H249]|uniref:potassium channel family protein n=1 Tax=Pontibacter sp. H249 TaxID=3133420 RepID=UPI0030BEA0BB